MHVLLPLFSPFLASPLQISFLLLFHLMQMTPFKVQLLSNVNYIEENPPDLPPFSYSITVLSKELAPQKSSHLQ